MKTLIHEEVFRGERILAKMAAQSLVVCGCGAIGSNFVDNAARQGFTKFTVIDMDRVEDHNRHTQVWDRRAVGQLKAAMIKNHVFGTMGITVEAVTKRLDETNVKKLIPSGVIVIDGFDNSKSRKIVTDHCRENKIDCLHIGLFEGYAEAIWNESYHVTDDADGVDVCEYPLARNIIMLAVAVGTEALIRYLETGTKKSYSITLGDFKVSLR